MNCTHRAQHTVALSMCVAQSECFLCGGRLCQHSRVFPLCCSRLRAAFSCHGFVLGRSCVATLAVWDNAMRVSTDVAFETAFDRGVLCGASSSLPLTTLLWTTWRLRVGFPTATAIEGGTGDCSGDNSASVDRSGRADRTRSPKSLC